MKILYLFAGISLIFVQVRRWKYSALRVRAASCLLSLWVRIQPEALMSSLLRLCFFQLEVPATGYSFIQRSSTECGTSECDCEASKMRRSCPLGALALLTRSIIIIFIMQFAPKRNEKNVNQMYGCKIRKGIIGLPPLSGDYAANW